MKAHGLSYEEIGERNGWTYTNVNRAITEGRRRFLRAYEGIESGSECERFAPIVEALGAGPRRPRRSLEIRPHLRHCTACRATVRDLHLSRLRRASLFWPIFIMAEPLGLLGAVVSDRRRAAPGARGATAQRLPPARSGRRGAAPAAVRRRAAVAARSARGSGRRPPAGVACGTTSRSSSIARTRPTSRPAPRSCCPAAAAAWRPSPRCSDCASAAPVSGRSASWQASSRSRPIASGGSAPTRQRRTKATVGISRGNVRSKRDQDADRSSAPGVTAPIQRGLSMPAPPSASPCASSPLAAGRQTSRALAASAVKREFGFEHRKRRAKATEHASKQAARPAYVAASSSRATPTASTEPASENSIPPNRSLARDPHLPSISRGPRLLHRDLFCSPACSRWHLHRIQLPLSRRPAGLCQ